MKNHRFIIQLSLILTMLLTPLAASAISGHYSDPGGGQYWCNVYVNYTSWGQSYTTLTGDNETHSRGQSSDIEPKPFNRWSLLR